MSGGMVIVHVIATTEAGGGSEYLVELTHGLKGRGIQSRIITGLEGEASRRLATNGSSVRAVGRMGPGVVRSLAHAIRESRPDVLHLHGSRSGLLGTLAARQARVRPRVYTAHAFSFHRRMPGLLRWLAARAESVTCGAADAVICLTQGDMAAAATHGIPTGRFRVVPNGIDIARFPSPTDRRAELGCPPEAPLVGMIARLVPQKDPVGFVRIASQVAAKRTDARFALVGDGELRTEVDRQARALGLEDRLALTGMRRDIPELLASFDVVVCPSLWEGLPLGLLEALAAGRAVVASALPGHTEVIEDGRNGRIAPPGNPAAFATAVLELLADPALRTRLGRCARETVERDYTLDRMVERTLAVYREVLEGPPGAVGATPGPRAPRHSA